jgi:novobiocin biosynthesis protein NovU/D-mycarose 3-C-methyltransferase
MQPLANNLVAEPWEGERFPLAVTSCRRCELSQLTVVVDPPEMFEYYRYVTGANQPLVKHFQSLATTIAARASLSYRHNPLCVDIGSNDGTLLSFLKEWGARVVGVDPAQNLAAIANSAGIPTYPRFFGKAAAEAVVADHGQATVITACNVFAHCPDIHDVMAGVRHLLAKDGIFIIEAPGLLEMLTQGTFDLIYHEHVSYLSLRPLMKLFDQYGMEIVDVQEVEVHGGSIRVFAKYAGEGNPVNARVYDRADREVILAHSDTYLAFADRAARVRSGLVQEIGRYKRVIGHGAPAKATVLINYCKLSSNDVAYIVDDAPIKQGMYVPGSDIKIVGAQDDDGDHDAVIVFPWNMADYIINKRGKGQYIVPMPDVRSVINTGVTNEG